MAAISGRILLIVTSLTVLSTKLLAEEDVLEDGDSEAFPSLAFRSLPDQSSSEVLPSLPASSSESS